MRVAIIDDEPQQRNFVKDIIGRYCPDIHIAGEAANVDKGMELIRAEKPELVLLDIDMPDGTGFDLLRKIGLVSFQVIFVTALDNFAIQAFRFAALDYLLKPTDPEELIAALRKAAQMVEQQKLQAQIAVLFQHLQQLPQKEKKIVLKEADAIHIVETQDVMYLQAEDNYTRFFFADHSSLLISKTLKDYEQLLEPCGFFRCHKSFMFNLSHLKKIEKNDAGGVILRNGSSLPLSIRKKEMLMQVLSAM